MRGRGSPKARAGTGGHALDDQLQRDQAGLDEPQHERRERRLEADHAVGRRRERHLLLGRVVRRVIGRDAVDRAVAQTLDERLPVRLGGQRRAHLEARRIEAEHLLVGQQQVVRRRLGGDVDAPVARAAHLLDRLLDVQVADVQRPALVLGDAQIAGDHRRLRDGRVAHQAEPRADRALVHVGRARERRVLAVQREHAPGGRRVLQRPPQERRRQHRPAVVGVAAGAVVGELAERGQLLAELPERDRSQEAHAHARIDRGPLVQRVEHLGRVHHGVGVGHREHACSSRRPRLPRCRSRDPPCAPGRVCAGARAGR